MDKWIQFLGDAKNFKTLEENFRYCEVEIEESELDKKALMIKYRL